MSDLPFPFIAVDGIANFRVVDAKPFKSNFLYRCGDTSGITADGKSKLRDIGIKRIFDFRSQLEFSNRAIPDIDGIPRTSAAIFKNHIDEDFKPENMLMYTRGPAGFVEGYMMVLDKRLDKAELPGYKAVFDYILENPSHPILAHCTAGRDRTGVFTAMVLDLIGVDADQIAREYNLSEIGLKDEYERLGKLMRQTNVLPKELLEDESKVKSLESSSIETMLQFLKVWHEKYGGAEGWLKGLYSTEQIEKLKKAFTEE